MLAAIADETTSLWIGLISDFALCRIAAKAGATRADVVRDLGPFFAHRLSPSEFRVNGETALDQLVTRGLASLRRGRFEATDAGVAQARAWLSAPQVLKTWPDIRDQQITALALGMADAPATRRRMLTRPDGLRAAILIKAYGLKLRGVPTPAQVRGALAEVALKRGAATDRGASGGVDAAGARSLAGHLAHRPRDFDTDTKLLSVLAAEAISAPQADVATLRLKAIRDFITRASAPAAPAGDAMAAVGLAGEAAPQAPKLEVFADRVRRVAKLSAEGWAGNRKAWVSRVCDQLRARHPEWRLTDDGLKALLLDAHRAGLITLASADLRTRDTRAALERSAITYKNTVWHLVRVE